MIPEQITIRPGAAVSPRVLAAEFPPEPGGNAIAVDHRGVAFQRLPGEVDRWSTRRDVLWFPAPRPEGIRGESRTWRQLHADGPVIVVWEPEGRDRDAAAALASCAPEGAPDAAV